MKRVILSAITIAAALSASAQQLQTIHNPVKNVAQRHPGVAITGNEVWGNLLLNTNPYVHPMAGQNSNKAAVAPELVGTSKYDLQTNYSVQNRIKYYDDKTMSVVWTMGSVPTAFPERGSGYNYWDGTNWTIATNNTTRLENIRVGWPSIDYIEQTNKGEYVLTHDGTNNYLHTVKRPTKGTGTFTDADLTQITCLWPRMKTGGPNGSTVHVISLTPPVANGGTAYQGQDGAIVYSRSLDGGATWDKVMEVLPGMGSANYNGFSADVYALDVKGNNVAIFVTGQWWDSFIMKSTDNGNTWTKIMVNPFPIAGYSVGAAGSISDLNGDGIADTVTTSDGSGAIIIDNNNKCHVWFGAMRVLDDNPAADSTAYSYFPGTSGLFYWNENMTGAPQTITDVIDDDGDGTFNLTGIDAVGQYFTSLTSMPSGGVDAQNNLYLSYAGLSEKTGGSGTPQNLRRLYVMKSNDGGTTWSAPFDPQKDPVEGDEFGEYVFASMAKNVDTHVRLIVQRDYEPGLSIRGDLDQPTDNDQLVFNIPVNWETIGVKEETPVINSVNVFPNPASELVYITFQTEKASDVNINFTDISGKLVKSISAGYGDNGNYVIPVNVNELSKGVYFVNIKSGNASKTEKLIIK